MRAINKKIFFILFCLVASLTVSKNVYATEEFIKNEIKIANVFVDKNSVITLDIENEIHSTSINPEKIEIYRSESENGEYTLLSTVNCYEESNDDSEYEDDYDYYEENYEEENVEDYWYSAYPIQYIDKTAVAGKTYYYKIRTLAVVQDTTIYSEFNIPYKVTCITSPNKIKYVRSSKEKTFTIKWSKTSNVDGYTLYIKEFPNKYLSDLHYYSEYEIDGKERKELNYEEDMMEGYMPKYVYKKKFKKVATIAGASKTSYKYKKAKHGHGYIVKLCTYKNVNGKKVESTVSYNAHGVMDYYFCPNAENTKFNYKWPKTQKSAKKMMKTIKVKMWDYKNRTKHSGKKYTRYQYITVNKKYAPTVVQIYKEIYKSKKKPPIYEAGSFRWRKNEKSWSYHTVGTAIDMNCNENPMYGYNSKGKRKIVVGSFYKPKTNPYSIPRNGVIEKTFAKYGFDRYDNDLMHFNAGYICGSTNY